MVSRDVLDVTFGNIFLKLACFSVVQQLDFILGKKFNLDRHNRSIHKRDTPEDFPTVDQQQSPLKIESSPSPVNSLYISDEEETIENPKKKRSKPNPLSGLGVKNRVKCKICKKFFKRGSLQRHMIIHSGEK
jgi:hypothetical protein